ncbi:extracellular solute-binding protein [Paenibacillus sp. S150]|uniref:extracellular solute-binding protein n=1 Tax=Paenibacillus sp. S150 TaxID=2749826 RepID=UPI001C566C41|nr:extracellular solute-binding protein [Paenibacillus sp. S150]MBW4079882.1 extracellular solute-binding protein [Paenibacillus sp. S150]
MSGKVKLKSLLSFAAVTVLTAGLAGCGGTSSSNDNGAGTSAEPNASDSNQKVKLSVVGNSWDATGMETVKTEAATNGVEISDLNYLTRLAVEEQYTNYDITWNNWGWAEQLDQKQRAAFVGGNVPDVVHGETFMPSYASEDLLEPLPQDIIDMVNPNFLIKNEAGEPVAVSPKGNVFLLFYNKDLLSGAGLDPDSIKLDTWAQWQAAADQITASGGGKIFGGGIPSHPHNGGAFRVYPFLDSLGGSWGGGDTVTLDTPEMLKTMEFVREMDKNFPQGVGNGTDEAALYRMFETDKTLAFVVNGSWQASGAATNKINYGVAQLPAAEEGGKQGNVLVGFDYYAVPKVSKNKEAAFNIIRTLLSKDIAVKFATLGVNPVANKEALADPEVLDSNPILKTAIEAMTAGEIKSLPVFKTNDAQIWDIINTKIIAQTTMTKDSIADLLKQGQSDAEKYLNQ